MKFGETEAPNVTHTPSAPDSASKLAIPTADASKASATGKRGPRGPRGSKGGEDHALYCLDTGKGEGGNISLSKPGTRKDILVQALKTGVHYFRLQKYQAQVQEMGEGKYEVVGIPVE